MKTSEEVSDWIRNKIGEEIEMSPEDISLDAPFSTFGIDSIIIITLIDDLENWLDTSLDPTIFWEFPSINAVANWLVNEKLKTKNARL